MPSSRSLRSSTPARPAGGPPPRNADRRKARRVSASQLPAFAAHLMDGPVVEVLNVSRTGMLTRSEVRLMPGAMLGLRILTSDDSFALFGRVVRSRLVSIDGDKPLYESALSLSREFPLLAASATSGHEAIRPAPAAGEGAPYPREVGRLGGAPVMLTVTAFSNDAREDVLRVFDLADPTS